MEDTLKQYIPSQKQTERDWDWIVYIVESEGYTGYQLERITGIKQGSWYRWFREGLPSRLRLEHRIALHNVAEYFRRMFPKQWNNFVIQREVEPV